MNNDLQPLVEEGEKLLQTVARKAGLTPHGVAFLTAALDPMHDSVIDNLSGWPDAETGTSIVRCIKTSLTIRTPYTTGSGNWNAAIIGWPWLMTEAGQSYTREGNFHAINPLNTVPSLGGLTAHASTSTNFNWIGNVPANGALTSCGNLSLSGQFHKGYGRLIGYGVEVVDQTADLYKQGLVTTFRVNQGTPQREVSYTNGFAGASGYWNTVRIRPPPRNLAEAMLLPGTRQWPAREGSYAVASFTGSENEAVAPQYEDIHFTYDDAQPGLSDPGLSVSGWTTAVNVNSTIMVNKIPRKVEQINTVGMMFTGLNEQSTLTVKWNVFYETFPGPDEPEILVLARPPANYDLMALEVLKREILNMPVGCYSGMNPNGEWFWEIVNDIADFAPILSTMMPELSPLIGAGAKAAKSFAQSKLAKEKRRETQRNKPKTQQIASAPQSASGKPSRRKPGQKTAPRTTKQPRK